jgi:hypothetical protein
MWRLTTYWYGDRLDPAFQPKPVDQLQGYLTDVGLVSEFWRLV